MNTPTQQRIGTVHPVFRAGIAAGVTALMVLATSAPALAGPYIGPDVTVHYADLDINTATGAESLYERIQRAAARVCPEADNTALVEHTAVLRCRNEVVAHAVSRLSSPRVTAIYAARTHHATHSPV